ncbi:hypothetical protein [Rhodocaloribacter sp.]
MKDTVIFLLSVIIGVWFVFDGIHVLVKGKYFGSPEPGPWASVVRFFGMNPFALGVPFVILGLLWLVSSYAVFSHQSWAGFASLTAAMASIWYLPFGTVISVLVLVLLWLQ